VFKIENVFLPNKFTVNTMNELYQFTNQDLELVSQIKKHQNITSIFYHFWINLVNPEEKFVFVDTIEIVFDKTTTYFFKINEEDNGYVILTNYNFEDEQKALAEKFQEVLSLKRIDVSQATIWKEKIKTPLLSVNTVVDYENRNENFIHFDFIEGSLAIYHDEEKGLQVEDYEF
jgi:hypothetical protein